MSSAKIKRQDPHTIPPKPPDIQEAGSEIVTSKKPSFKDSLLSEDFMEISSPLPQLHVLADRCHDSPTQGTSDSSVRKGCITLSEEDLARIYDSWKFSVIIKPMGKRFLHQILKKRITELWKPTESFPFIDLGNDYFIAKFTKAENMVTAISQGPWFVNGCYLSVMKWEPNFIASKAKQLVTAIWVRLLELPTEFYDGFILQKIGNSLGKLPKVDACTSATLRGRCARLCVEIPVDEPVESHVYIGTYRQAVLYEGEKILCKVCGCLSHTQTNCTKSVGPIPIVHQKSPSPLYGLNDKGPKTDEWHTVSFSKSKKQPNKAFGYNKNDATNAEKGPYWRCWATQRLSTSSGRQTRWHISWHITVAIMEAVVV